jgi:tRNA G26 N,N-dimethylase Trm1
LGYKAVQTYYDHTLWKTDAPPEVIYDIVKSHKQL